MKSERILNTLGQVEDKYIEEAAPAGEGAEDTVSMRKNIEESAPKQEDAEDMVSMRKDIEESALARTDAEDTVSMRENIEESAPARKAERLGWLRWGTLVACLGITVCAGMQFAREKEPGGNLPESSERGAGENRPDLPGISENGISSGIPEGTQGGNPNLPTLKITENANAEGFEGYMAYDISDLVNANPWSEDLNLSALPVYRNTLSYDESFIVSDADFEAMRSFLREIASRFGMDADNLVIRDNTPTPEQQAAILEKTGGDIPEGYFNPTAVTTEEGDIKIEVDTAMTATVTFEPARALPDGYNFTHYAPCGDIRAVAGYLQDAYGNLMEGGDFKTDIRGGDYNIYGQQMYEIGFYGKGGLLGGSESLADNPLAEEVLNYNFRRMAFYCDDQGKLWMVRLFYPDLSDKVGEYPILSPAEAEELLLRGSYITTVPYEMPGQDYIAGVELIYRTGKYEEYYMPYYRFYVEVPALEKDGMKDYGAYYVPAVSPEYIANMP